MIEELKCKNCDEPVEDLSLIRCVKCGRVTRVNVGLFLDRSGIKRRDLTQEETNFLNRQLDLEITAESIKERRDNTVYE